MRGWLLLACALALPLSASAQSNGDSRTMWLQANNAFHSGEYAKAASAYQEMIQQGADSADVYFNLGTAELRAGRRGAAILAFERALRQNPNDADASHNLEEAQKGNVDKIVGVRDEEPFIERLGSRIPVGASGIAFLSAWLVLWAALFGRLFARKGREWLNLVAGGGALVATIAGAMLGISAWQRASGAYAVVVSSEASIREGPAKNFKAAFEVHEGLKLRVIDREQDFLRVRLPNGTEGWIAANDAPVI